MRHYTLPIVAFLTLVLTLAVFSTPGYFFARLGLGDESSGREARVVARSSEALASQAARRWRHAQATHWRAQLLR